MTGRPDPVRRLADADAGLPDPAAAARVRAEATADPAAAAVLDALAATRADLAALAPPPVPDAVAARWDAALAAADTDTDTAQDPPSPPRESHVSTARVARLDSASRTSREPEPDSPPRVRPPARAPRGPRTPEAGSRGRRGRRLVAAAVLAVAVTATVLLAGPERPVAVARVDLAAAARSAVGVDDLGALADPRRRAACLAAIGLAPVPDERVLGGRGVLLDGTPGTLLVLATGELGVLRIIVVDPACGADGRGTLLAETVIP